MFLYFHDKEKAEGLGKLGKLLGLIWDREELLAPEGRPDGTVEVIHVPLSLLLDPKLKASLRTQIIKDKDDQGKPVAELGLLGKEAFLDHYRRVEALKK